MKTYILVGVHDEDCDYVEELLRAAARGCQHPVDIHESKPLPSRRRRKPANLATTADES